MQAGVALKFLHFYVNELFAGISDTSESYFKIRNCTFFENTSGSEESDLYIRG